MKLLLLDKDGTLTHPASGAKFTNLPYDQTPLPGSRKAIERYAAEGWTIAIISNQGGVAAGHKSLESVFMEMEFALGLFPLIQEAYFCPCPTDTGGNHCWRVWGDCNESRRIRYGKDLPHRIVSELEESLHDTFRKPNAGMLKLAIDIYGAESALMVGDRPEDEAAAHAAGVPFMWAEHWLSAP
jgi:D-glycero-D-manno-heptose 1,7-bisphosphate phosphatase